MNLNLFPLKPPNGLIHLRDYLDLNIQNEILHHLEQIISITPLRSLKTRSGGKFSTKITNCGKLGWWSDQKGYYYTPCDPDSGASWPNIPQLYMNTISSILKEISFPISFKPDACLINYYSKDSKMGLHQDKDEENLKHPIMTISLGDKADFLIGGNKRSIKPDILSLNSGDILIMSNDSRLYFHGIKKIYPGTSPINKLVGRFSLTFRKAREN